MNIGRYALKLQIPRGKFFIPGNSCISLILIDYNLCRAECWNFIQSEKFITSAMIKYIKIKAIVINGKIILAQLINLVSNSPYMFPAPLTLTLEFRSIISSLITSAVNTKKGIINPNINQ